MNDDRSAIGWAARVLHGVAGVALGLYVTGLGWDAVTASSRYDDALLSGTPGWWLVIGGLAFAGGSGAWAFVPKSG